MLQIYFIFSYWVLLWYLLYEFSFVKYNPKLWLIIILCFNLIQSLVMIYYNKFFMLFLFIFVIFIMKIIPLWTLRNTRININDFIFGVVLFFIYYLFLLYNNYTLYKIIKILYFSIKYNNQVTPMMYIINKLIK